MFTLPRRKKSANVKKYYKILLKSVNQATQKVVERTYLIPETSLNQDIRNRLQTTGESQLIKTPGAQMKIAAKSNNSEVQFIPNLALSRHLKSTLLASLGDRESLTPSQTQNTVLGAISGSNPQTTQLQDQEGSQSVSIRKLLLQGVQEGNVDVPNSSQTHFQDTLGGSPGVNSTTQNQFHLIPIPPPNQNWVLQRDSKDETTQQSEAPIYSQPIIKKIILNPTFFESNPSQNVTLVPLLSGSDPNQSDVPNFPRIKLLPRVQNYSELYKCKTCALNFDTPGKLSSHMYVHKKRTHKCEQCGKAFHTSSRLGVHMLVHTEDKKFPCDVCGKIYKTKYTLKTHSCTDTVKERNVNCDVCGKKFYKLQGLKDHVNTEHLNVTHKCNICKKEYRQIGTLKAHKRTHDPHFVAPSLKCDRCEAKFKNRTALRNHKLKVHEGKLFMCDICGKEITSSASFRIHMRTHTGEKPYVCEICGKGFISKELLRTHIRIHTKEKPYPCKLCGKRFSQTGSVKIHVMRVHRREKKFQCNVCGKKYVSKVQLKAHTKLHGVPLSELGTEADLAKN